MSHLQLVVMLLLVRRQLSGACAEHAGSGATVSPDGRHHFLAPASERFSNTSLATGIAENTFGQPA